ncbi:ATPase [Myxococcus sp. K15C18031901]|uniref:ATPase n=1 Tax=Myxococcus dinghuensis TaxID=2906761 RepID=UPI0020A7C29B|nr:ATPase [Myxococcus dinghuensis]MCP3100493.1 ATPase [Myxococcus dinghuensis]
MTLFRRPSPATAGDSNDESSRSVTPTEAPVVPEPPGSVLSAPPRPRTGAAPALPERRPAPPGAPARSSASADSDGPEFPTERRPAGPGAPGRPPAGPPPSVPGGAPERRPAAGPGPLPSVIVSGQESRRPAAAAAPPPSSSERRANPQPPYGGPERRAGVSGATGSRRALDPNLERFWPAQPRALDETGLTATFVEELVLKALFFAGEMRGMDLASRLQLPTSVVDDIIEGLRRQKYVDIRGGGASGVGKSTMIYQLTPFVTDVLRQILDRNRYNGPAPIPFQEYVAAVKRQTVRGNRITRARMQDKFGDLIIRDYIYDGIGPAMNSGRAIFFYGPPGNGKTAICQGMVNCFEGDVFIPHAILIDDFVVRVFDANLHKPVEDDSSPSYDRRWVRCRRPLVVVGGELTLEMLDLVYSPEVKYYEAPFQMKASNGMLLIDDFGRQKVSPKDLLNRWIVPLESDIDMLTLHTGKKLQVPFDVFAAFSTNLDPSALVDDAFLRRVRYKLEVRRPDEEQFHQIFEVMCRKRGVAYNANAVDYLIDAHYRPSNRPFAACQPRDLLDQVIDMSHYLGQEPRLDPALLDAAVRSYFVRFDKPAEPTAASAA